MGHKRYTIATKEKERNAKLGLWIIFLCGCVLAAAAGGYPFLMKLEAHDPAEAAAQIIGSVMFIFSAMGVVVATGNIIYCVWRRLFRLG